MRKETDYLVFYYLHLCSNLLQISMSLSEERNGVNGAGGFVNIHALAGSFIFSLLFAFTESRKNQVTDPLGDEFFFYFVCRFPSYL